MERSAEAPAAVVRQAVTDAEALAREQLSAVWQLQLDKVRETLETGWRDHVERLLGERFEDIRAQLEERYAGTVEIAARTQADEIVESARRGAVRELSERLNQTARRMRQADSREVWIQALLEAASEFCGRAGLFAVKAAALRYEGGLGVDEQAGPAEIALASAPAFANAVESKDTVVSLATADQLSTEVAELFGSSSERRVYLFPFAYRGAVVGVLYAEPEEDPIDVNGLELLTALAETSIEPEAAAVSAPGGLVRIEGEVRPEALQWTSLPRADQEVHARAERFARNRVAQIMLYKIHQVRTGRDGAKLYATLKEDIDAGREAFRDQFMRTAPGVPDYFHAELVRTLAKDDAALLGEGYPGPLR